MAMKIPKGEVSLLTHIPETEKEKVKTLGRVGGYYHTEVYRLALMWSLDDPLFRLAITAHAIPRQSKNIAKYRKIRQEAFDDPLQAYNLREEN